MRYWLLWSLLCAAWLGCSSAPKETAEADTTQNDTSAPPVPTKIRFQDSSGLLNVGASRVFGVGLVDYNQDGWPDVTMATKTGVLLLQNRGEQGGFVSDNKRAQLEADLSHAHQVVWVDYDNDDDLDLFVTRREMPGPTGEPKKQLNRLLQNDGKHHFRDVTTEAGLADPGFWEGAAFGDLDGDGDLDLVVLGGITFDPDKEFKPGYEGYPNAFWRNNGDGTFESMTSEMGCTGPDDGVGWGLLLVDFDHDGDLDMFISNDRRASTICRNAGDGTFEDISHRLSDDIASFGAMGVSAGDINGDGCIELYATIFGPDVILSINEDADFIDIYPYLLGDRADPSANFSGYGATFLDADLDGDQDIMWVAAFDTQGYAQGVYIPGAMGLLENRGGDLAGSLIDVGPQANGHFANIHHAWGLARGDYDRDGDMDLLLAIDAVVPVGAVIPAGAEVHSSSILLENVTPTGNNRFLELTLRQPPPNQRAVGATVIVSVNGRRAVQVVTAGSSYLSAHQYPLHYGLNDNESADWVFVRWPDGISQTWTDVSAGRVTLEKGTDSCTPVGTCEAVVAVQCHDYTADLAKFTADKGVLSTAQCQVLCEHMAQCGWFPGMDFCDYDDCVMLCPSDDIPEDIGLCALETACGTPPACITEWLEAHEREEPDNPCRSDEK